MANFTRRQSLGLLAAASIPPTAAVAVAAGIPEKSNALNTEPAVNPALSEAYRRLLDAKAELAAAKDALEWLADEWRHLWPLAPEELLSCGGAKERDADAERDIIGRCIIRDTAALTKRYSRKQRQERPRDCFTVTRSDDAFDSLERWRRSKTVGRTAAGSLRLAKAREDAIAKFERQYHLALKYEEQTAHLRLISGAEEAHKRVSTAETREVAARRAVFVIKATTADELRIKAAALDEGMLEIITSPVFTGSFGDLGRFVVEAMDVLGRSAV